MSRKSNVIAAVNCDGGLPGKSELIVSYDIRLFQRGQDETVEQSIERALSKEEEESNPGPQHPKKEQRKQSIAAAWIKKNPQLEVYTCAIKKSRPDAVEKATRKAVDVVLFSKRAR